MSDKALEKAALLFPLIAGDVFQRLALFGYPLGGETPPSDLVQAIIRRVYYEKRCAAVGLAPETWIDGPRPRYERVT
jgi:hypothetical protein